MSADFRIFRRNLERLPRSLALPYRVAEVGWLPDQLNFHRGRVLEALYICVTLSCRHPGIALIDGARAEGLRPPLLEILPRGTRLDTIRGDRHDEIFFKYLEPAAAAILKLGLRSCRFALTPELEAVIGEIKSVIDTVALPGMIERLDWLAVRFFTEIMLNARPEESVPEESQDADCRFDELVSHLLLHLHERVPAQELAARFGLSRSVFYRLWRRRFSVTPLEFVNRQRLTLAERLLARSEMRIGEIAEHCGFAGGVYFSDCFREHHGCSPREFRARIRRAGPWGENRDKS